MKLDFQPRRLLLIPLLIAFPAVLLAAPHIDNPDTPRDGVVDYRMEVDWRAGGLDDEENLFGLVVRVSVDETGDLYVLDSQLSTVTVFSPTGERLRTLSREGDGPGETRNPNDLLFLPGGKLGLMQIFPGRIVLIDREGTPAGEFPYSTGGGFAVLVRGLQKAGNVVLAGIDQSFDQGRLTQTYFLRGYTPSGERICEYATKSEEMNFAAPVLDETAVDWIWTRFDVATDGRVIVAPERNAYRIEVHAPDGERLRSFGRAYESLIRDADDTALANGQLKAQGRHYPSPPQTVVAETEPDIVAMNAMPDGSVWVLSSRGTRASQEGVHSIWDVFDADGVFTHQARISAEGDGRHDLSFLVDGERIVLVHGFLDSMMTGLGVETDGEEAEPMEIVSGRLVR